MEQQTVRKAYKSKLKPTAEQERVLDRTFMLCRHVYNAVVEERRVLRGGVAVAASENRESAGFSRGECQTETWCS